MPDPIFADPRLAAMYDAFDGPRDDLDHYVAMVAEFGARSVIDIGCGTGVLACRMAQAGIAVTGVDPAEASLAVGRAKAGADMVMWIHGDASALPLLGADLAVMTGNVAQVFVTDADWSANLAAIRNALAPHGRLVFEVRRPSDRAWLRWDRESTFQRLDIAGVGTVEMWVDVTSVALPLVSFRHTYSFVDDAASVITSDSTLRFREHGEIVASLAAAGYAVVEVGEAPDRPGAELVFVAEVAESAGKRAASPSRNARSPNSNT